jgi:ketosteroid isomerase-like protein
MSQENVDRFLELVEAFNRGDIPAILRGVDPEIRFEHRIAALQGKYAGLDGMRDFFADFVEHFESSQIDCADVRDLGDRVLGLGTLHATGKGSGAETELPFTVVASFSQGQITHFIDFGDKKQALQAAGLEE